MATTTEQIAGLIANYTADHTEEFAKWLHADNWMGFQYEFPLNSAQKLYAINICADRHVTITMRGYREE